ncbi:hypothetical protein SAMN05444157_0119 [Frankineae bacterium MT45]|nr:hypothetical protein SAMN05444157_0119 [Frankineae bacterium MT45]
MTTLTDRPADASPPPEVRLVRSRSSLLSRINLCGVVVAAAFVCWLIAMPGIGHVKESQYGLLPVASPFFVASIILTTVGFALAVRAGSTFVAWAAVFCSVAILRVTISLATAVPYYSWTYKHIAVVDYIEKSGKVARDVDIYHHWPGLFAFTAWFSDLTGLSATTIAHWYTPVAYIIEVGVLYAMARAWDCKKMTAIIVTFLVQNLDWIGQGYFSPQWTAFMLALGVVTLIGLSRKQPRYLWLMIVLFTALTVTHQLTPYWLIAVTGLMFLTRQVKPWWLFIVFIAIAGGFLTYNWESAAQFHLLNVNPISNAQTNVPTIGIKGQQVTSGLVRLLCASFWVTAIIAAIIRIVQRKPFMAASVLAFSAFGILGGQGYGGEAIFRVFLFSLPGCALLVAPLLESFLTARRRFWFLPAVALMTAWSIFSAQGLFGAWFAYRMTKEEVAMSTSLLNKIPIPAWLTSAAPVWPERNSANYVNYARWNHVYDQQAIYATSLVGSHFSSDKDYAKVNALVAARGDVPTYFIITKQMQFYDWYFGILPYDALPNLETRMKSDPKWSTYYESGSVIVFKSNFFPTQVAAK